MLYKSGNKSVVTISSTLCTFLFASCQSTDAVDTDLPVSLALHDGQYVTGEETLQAFLGLEDPVGTFYTDYGCATIHYECDIETINLALQKIASIARDNDIVTHVSFANGPLKTVPFSPLGTDEQAIEYSLRVFISSLTTHVIGPIDDGPPCWRLDFEFNVTDDELRQLRLPITLPIQHGGSLSRLIERHNERRTGYLNEAGDWEATRWEMVTGSFRSSESSDSNGGK